MERRRFLKVAASAAAAGGLAPGNLLAAPPAVDGRRPEGSPARVLQDTEVALGNGEPPALQFQAYPGGTGALFERLIRERGAAAFERRPLDIEPWDGPVPAREEDVAFLPVDRLGALVRERKISPVELTEIYLERLQRYDPILLCAVTILEGPAREAAEQAEAEIRRGEWRGPLHGIPWGVKDLFAVRGTPTTWGSAAFQDQVIDEDSDVVVRLREAGAVLIAKLSTGEFARGANWFRGQTLNPWNLEEGSSGSSAGPASATAAGCVAFAIGTETQGSIVSPARRCGLTALRPTFGRVSRHGGMVLAWSMDKVGPLCRTAEDCALVFDVIHGADPKDASTLTTPFEFERRTDLSGIRIGIAEDAPDSFAMSLRDLGADLRPLPELPEGGSEALSVESAAAFDFHVADLGSQGQEGEEARFQAGRTVPGLDYVQSQRRRMILMQQMEEALEGVDLFVSGSGLVGVTNQTGHPAVILPYTFGPREDAEHEQPVCTTLIGRPFTDDLLLTVAHAYQSVTSWHLERPSLD